MTKLEVACVIIGFILMFFSVDDEIKMQNCTLKSIFVVYFAQSIRWIVFCAMVLLPLYFNFWRR